ncbi:hypothetical protein BD289DRAFT_373006 [Coniella lustricola]|uniref:DNA-directed RNA polymerase subunit n=1 Tax=Coniella lustricola TaxID=2025994 RepID=A0A2T3A1K2_9PEZI|nr:hypothetical protein BD289DRAFT_373006 [Coniella lustricola]
MPVSILFCPECSNMLYPKEDKEARRLMYQCRTCQHTEAATSNCVYRNILKSQAGDTAGVTQDVALDPTLPRSDKKCPICGHEEAVFFQSQQRTRDTGMKLYYVCCSCGEIYQ